MASPRGPPTEAGDSSPHFNLASFFPEGSSTRERVEAFSETVYHTVNSSCGLFDYLKGRLRQPAAVSSQIVRKK
jgi:hypothetical protein